MFRGTKKCFFWVAVMLVLIVGIYFIFPNYSTDKQTIVRTVSMEKADLDYQSILDEFDDAKLEITGLKAEFVGYKALDPSLIKELNLVSLDETSDEEVFTVKYQVTADAENGNVSLSAILDKGEGEPIIDTIQGIVIEDESGEPDVMFIIDGEAVLLSELAQNDMLDNVGFFSFLKKAVKAAAKAVVQAVIVVIAPVVTAIAAMLSVSVLGTVDVITADGNYNHNLKQTFRISTVGVEKGYIDYQDHFSSWRYGLTTMDKNGCGIIATYNSLLHLKKFYNKDSSTGNTAEMARIARDFEKYHGTIAFGYAGTNPTHIAPYIISRGVPVTSFSGVYGHNAFFNSCNNITINQAIILTYWWQDNSGVGAHYVTIIKNPSGSGYIILNDDSCSYANNIYDYVYKPYSGSQGFIQGWIIG